jgi:hypothetical protein
VSCEDDLNALAPLEQCAVHRHLGTGRLRTDKPVPDFLDLFGWDAFYKAVSANKVLAGWDTFARRVVEPRC